MIRSVTDVEALEAVPPAALSAYARAAGWTRTEEYGQHSDVYVAEGKPEIIVPRTARLGDYANVVWDLIRIFAKVAETGERSLYRDLMTADRDLIRVRAGSPSGELTADDGIALFQGSRDMLLAAACSLESPRPVYRAGANKEASDFLRRVRLGQTEPGSFVVTLLTPTISPPDQPPLDSTWEPPSEPLGRRISKRLVESVRAARRATERVISGDAGAFLESVPHGVSANLCEALAGLVEPFPSLDVSISWALTVPSATPRDTVGFASSDGAILSAAARTFRERAPGGCGGNP